MQPKVDRLKDPAAPRPVEGRGDGRELRVLRQRPVAAEEAGQVDQGHLEVPEALAHDEVPCGVAQPALHYVPRGAREVVVEQAHRGVAADDAGPVGQQLPVHPLEGADAEGLPVVEAAQEGGQGVGVDVQVVVADQEPSGRGVQPQHLPQTIVPQVDAGGVGVAVEQPVVRTLHPQEPEIGRPSVLRHVHVFHGQGDAAPRQPRRPRAREALDPALRAELREARHDHGHEVPGGHRRGDGPVQEDVWHARHRRAPLVPPAGGRLQQTIPQGSLPQMVRHLQRKQLALLRVDLLARLAADLVVIDLVPAARVPRRAVVCRAALGRPAQVEPSKLPDHQHVVWRLRPRKGIERMDTRSALRQGVRECRSPLQGPNECKHWEPTVCWHLIPSAE
mmetsp:Transcript_67603/g.197859  ORF Transcript_67603/g.197859 Transcript_67603/m.197859 type:complete len:391 (-) Transcript_67603:3-1175(-)